MRRFTTQILKLRNRHFFVLDTLIFATTPFLAIALRIDDPLSWILENKAPLPHITQLLIATILFIVVKFTVSFQYGLYRNYWQYASVGELVKIFSTVATALISQTLLFFIFQELLSFSLPRSLPIIDGILTLLLVGSSRFTVRITASSSQQRIRKLGQYDPVLIIGAGNAGVRLVQELQRNSQLGLLPVAFVDDDPLKINHRICGLPVVGSRNIILEAIRAWHIRKSHHCHAVSIRSGHSRYC